jgi:Arc/MetJ-type ribon-helix-helix transcriptional regulator
MKLRQKQSLESQISPRTAAERTENAAYGMLKFAEIEHYRLTRTLAISRLTGMEVNLTPDQKAFVRQAIESGRLHREEDAVQEALSLWEERERKRAEFLATIEDAKVSTERGQGRLITQQSMQELAEEVKQRGLARLPAEQDTSR